MESTISAAPQISIDREKTLRSHRRYWVLRRAQDIVFSLLALILLAPMALLISLAIAGQPRRRSYFPAAAGRTGRQAVLAI